jgi:hypothetical protein
MCHCGEGAVMGGGRFRGFSTCSRVREFGRLDDDYSTHSLTHTRPDSKFHILSRQNRQNRANTHNDAKRRNTKHKTEHHGRQL